MLRRLALVSLLVATAGIPGVAFKEDVIVPTAHSEQNAPKERDVMPMVRENNLRRGSHRYLVVRKVVSNVDFCNGPVVARLPGKVLQYPRGLELAGRDHIQHLAHLPLEH